MLNARLEYIFSSEKTYTYVRTMDMSSEEPNDVQNEGQVITEQVWQVAEEREDYFIVDVKERVISRTGALAQQFRDPAPVRKVYMDGCGLLPKSGQEFPTLSAFPGFLEDAVEPGDAWENPEMFPNWPTPVEIRYTLKGFVEKEQLIAVLSSQGSDQTDDSGIEVHGKYRFAVASGLLLESELIVDNDLPNNSGIRLVVRTVLQS